MLSMTLKRSAATLGVAAGLLAAAGPASAQFLPTGTGVKAPANAKPGSISGQEMTDAILSVKAPRNLNDVEAIDFNALGTQVGSEGVKRNGRAFFDIPAELNTFGGNDTLRAPGGVVGVINELLDVKGPNAGTQIGIED